MQDKNVKMPDKIKLMRNYATGEIRPHGAGTEYIRADLAAQSPAPVTEEKRRAVFDPKRYNRRECFADSEDGLHASICYDDMLNAALTSHGAKVEGEQK